MEGSSDGLELSLKLYHVGELQLGYQQLMTEAPVSAFVELERVKLELPDKRLSKLLDRVPELLLALVVKLFSADVRNPAQV